jgi:hypothetical protein
MLGVVTVTYNSAAVIDGFLRSVLSQTHCEFVLYIVDNASIDDTVSSIGRYKDTRIRTILNRRNAGFAEGSNRGIRAALQDGCDAVLLVNNDTEFEPGLFDKLVHGLSDYKCDIITPKIVFYGAQNTIWSAGGGFNPWKGYAGFHYGLGEPDCGQYNLPRTVEHAPGCCALVRSSVFSAIGLMDSLYFVYLDDTDFCYRAKEAGLKIIYLPAAILLHKASSLTGGPESVFSVRFRTRNQIYFMLKHLGVWRSLYYLPAFQVYQLAKLLLRKIDFAGFLLRERAFFEGLAVWRRSTAR